jgi:hypothetical protein
MKVLMKALAALTRKIGILMHPCSMTIVAPLKKLWNLARNGMRSNEDMKIAEKIIAAFSAPDDDNRALQQPQSKWN